MKSLRLLLKIVKKSLLIIAIAAISSGVTYVLCSRMYDDEVAELKQQVQDLEAKELQARVTQRVSEQLEGIASQQTLISNKERDRAEEQSHIAELERGKAEREKGLAMQAQQVAETQSKIAKENMVIAQQARSHADTLLYVSLANSLAQSSLTQAQSGNSDLSRLLSSASWYYSDIYQKGVSNQQNIYKSLLQSSGSIDYHNTSLQGNIRKIRVNGSQAYAVTDYGEVYTSGKSQHTLRLGSYDFRDFIFTQGTKAAVLCADGRIVSLDMSAIDRASTAKDVAVELKTTLPQGKWYHLLSLNDGKTLVATSSKKIVWLNASDYSVIASDNFSFNVTAIGMQDQRLYVFCESGMLYSSDKAGKLEQKKLKGLDTDANVTAYLYDKQKGYHFLGTRDGGIFVFDKRGARIAELIGHSAAITDLQTWGELLGSTSYDTTINLWDISDFTALISPISINTENWPLTFAVDTKNEKVWIGTEKGDVMTFCSSVEKNAESTRKALTREFTDDEWDYYVGSGIEKVKFMRK